MRNEWKSWASRLAGGALLAVPFVPLRRLFGDLQGAGALVPPSEWALGVGIFAVVAWLVTLAAGPRLDALQRWPEGFGRAPGRRWVTVSLAVLAVLVVAASWGAFHRSPHLIDSIVQLFQGKIFASGTLAAPAPPEGGFFTTLHMVEDGGKWYSQYPPGHAGLLAPGVAAGAPWLVPVVLSLGSAGLLYGAAGRIYGKACARLTLVLAVLCPFFWFMGASFMNHVSSLFFVALFFYLFGRWEEAAGWRWALAAGAALGAAALSRPLTAVAVAAPFAGFAVAIANRRMPKEAGLRTLAPLAAAAVGFTVVASLYLVYNAQVTGAPFQPGYLKLWGDSHGLGFHATPWGGEHTPLTGLRNELTDLSLLNLYLFEWPVPGLLPVGVAFALGWTNERWDRRLLVAFLALPAAYFFYWHRDDFLGPRFLYSGLVFLLPLTARSLLEAAERLRGKAAHIGDLFRPVDAGAWAGILLLLCGGYAVFYGIPQRFHVYASGMPSMKTDLRKEAEDVGIDEGLVFVKVSWGNRILSRLRAEGVSASLATRAYRKVGHCELHLLVERSSSEDWSSGRISDALRDKIEQDQKLLQTDRLNDDPTLRLREGRELAPECREEIEYDRGGHTNYSPHLVANTPGLDGDFVVARDLRGANSRLTRRFPSLRPVRFDGTDFVRLPGPTAGAPKAGPEPFGDTVSGAVETTGPNTEPSGGRR